MFNRSLRFFLCLSLMLSLQFNTGFCLNVYAENSLNTNTQDTMGDTETQAGGGTVTDVVPDVAAATNPEFVTSIEGKSYIAPLGYIGMVYTINNYSEIDAMDVVISETLIAKDKIIKENDIKFYSSALEGPEIKGPSYTGELDLSPYTLRYSVKYKGQEILKGEETIHVLNTKLKVSYSANLPDKIFKGYNMAFKAEIQSSANVTLYNVVVSDSELGELGRIDRLTPEGKDSRKVIQKIIPANKSSEGYLVITFDNPLGLTDTITQRYENTVIKVKVSDEVPVSSLDITSTAGDVTSSGKIEFEIDIKNTGNTNLVDVEVLDWDGKVIYQRNKLAPNENYVIYHEADVEPGKSYEFTVKAQVEGSTNQIQDKSTAEVKKYEPKIEMERTIAPEVVKPGDIFTIHYQIVNVGDVPFKDIKISEPILGEIAAYEELKPGGEIGFTKEFTIEEAAYSQTEITAINTITGEEYEYEASRIEIPVEKPETFADLLVELKTEKELLEGTDTVVFECKVKNVGTETLTDLGVVLIEGGKVLVRIPSLSPGDEETFTLDPIRVEKTETYRVTVSATDEKGNELTFYSNELTVKVETKSGSVAILRLILTIIIILIIAIAGTLFYLVKGPQKLAALYRRKFKKGRAA